MEVTSISPTVNPYDYTNKLLFIMPVLFIVAILIIIYYLFSYKNSDIISNSEPGLSQILGFVILIILIILFALNAFQYFFSINITAYLQNLFSPVPKLDIVVDQGAYEPQPVPEIKFRKQVFNIPGNYYTYNDAKALCASYGSELANYQQIENAYNSGAEWCNYGWSAEQMALYPTQKNTYKYLQKQKGHEHDCGRPGINGGYIANPKVRFGANCYGYKPKINQTEEELMKIATPYPVTAQEIAFQKRVDYWKTKINDILVSPFNYNIWSEL